jgi:hypothetical protein
MASPHISLAPRGGYIVDLDLDVGERWWIQPNVEPFRTESRVLHGAPPFGPGPIAVEPAIEGSRVRMKSAEQAVRSDLIELEQLGMARRLP